MLSIISKRIIKPFSPTPSTQRWHKLSLLDQFLINNLPFVFFYPKSQVASIPKHQLSRLLANSLSKVLTFYYPWAGSLKDNSTIECDDHGAELLEVDINSPMNKVIYHPDLAFPQGLSREYPSSSTSSALTVAQLSHFECGGIAVSICLSHKVGDGCSTYYFLRDWAMLTRHPNLTLSPPYFAQDSLLPSTSDDPLFSRPVIQPEKREKRIRKSFIFSESKINALKALVVAESPIQNPMRNEVVNALLYKCAAASSTTTTTTNSGRSQLVQIANLRHQTTLQLSLPPTTIGNIFATFSTPIYENYEQDLKLPKLVTDIRKSKYSLFTLKENELVKHMLDVYRQGELPYHKKSCDVYRSTSLLAFEFGKLDFGFGKPTRVSQESISTKDFFILMNTTDDRNKGVEARVNLNEQDMSIFQNDKDLLQFATPIN